MAPRPRITCWRRAVAGWSKKRGGRLPVRRIALARFGPLPIVLQAPSGALRAMLVTLKECFHVGVEDGSGQLRLIGSSFNYPSRFNFSAIELTKKAASRWTRPHTHLFECDVSLVLLAVVVRDRDSERHAVGRALVAASDVDCVDARRLDLAASLRRNLD